LRENNRIAIGNYIWLLATTMPKNQTKERDSKTWPANIMKISSGWKIITQERWLQIST